MSAADNHVYEFGPFRLDPSEHTLLRDGRPVPLRPKVFDLLLFLVERHGRLVGKEELMRAVWPEQFVEDGNLNKTVSILRQALGESQTEQQYIETVPKRGYRFMIDVRDVKGDPGTTAGVRADVVRHAAIQPAPVEEPPGIRTRRFPAWSFAAAAAVIVALSTVGFYLRSSRGDAIDSVAVMPFATEWRDPQAEYLSEGMTDNLIATLSELGNLKVMSRNSVFRWKGQTVDAREAATVLRVRSVLTGALKKVDENLVIDVELIDARDGSVIWTRRYIRQSADLMGVQASVAQDVAENLRLQLTGSQQQQLTRRPTTDAEAYELYLKGRYFSGRSQQTPEDLRKGLESFQQAIARDPNFGPAYIGLANCYILQTIHGEIPASVSVPLAKAAIMTALRIDERLSEAHSGLAWIKFAYERDWQGVEAELQRALELNPNHATAHLYYGAYLTSQGRFEEATAKRKMALEFDPLSAPVRATFAWTLYFARRYDETIAQCRETLNLEEGYYRAHLYAGQAYEQKGMPDEALAELERAVRIAPKSPEVWAAIAHVQATSGNPAEARRILARLHEWSKEKPVDPYAIAIVYIGLGDYDAAFEWLNKALEVPSIMLVWLKVEPRLDRIRSDPRFHDLARRSGF